MENVDVDSSIWGVATVRHTSVGLQVVLIEDNRAPIVSHMVWYKVGSADEPLGQSGIAHFLEHLMFKGTRKFPEGEMSQIVARSGGNQNAFTSYDYTAYYQNVPKDKLQLMMELLRPEHKCSLQYVLVLLAQS